MGCSFFCETDLYATKVPDGFMNKKHGMSLFSTQQLDSKVKDMLAELIQCN